MRPNLFVFYKNHYLQCFQTLAEQNSAPLPSRRVAGWWEGSVGWDILTFYSLMTYKSRWDWGQSETCRMFQQHSSSWNLFTTSRACDTDLPIQICSMCNSACPCNFFRSLVFSEILSWENLGTTTDSFATSEPIKSGQSDLSNTVPRRYLSHLLWPKSHRANYITASQLVRAPEGRGRYINHQTAHL